jgi:diadenosine tetraphosphate (Ap4A) HIT family hydrolase
VLAQPSPATAGCYICERNAAIDGLPSRERISAGNGWRLAHAFDSSLPGWLVLVPTRHVEALDELDAVEAGALGEMLVRSAAALREVVGCSKTYTMLFAEADGFAHLHFHVVPRMSTFTPDVFGPNVFRFLGRPPGERVSDDAQDRLAAEIALALAQPGAVPWSS